MEPFCTSHCGVDKEKLQQEVTKLQRIIADLEKRLHKRSRVKEAKYEVLKDELKVDNGTLIGKLAEVVRDKANQAEQVCAHCSRRLGDKKKYMYCGEERKLESVFDLR